MTRHIFAWSSSFSEKGVIGWIKKHANKSITKYFCGVNQNNGLQISPFGRNDKIRGFVQPLNHVCYYHSLFLRNLSISAFMRGSSTSLALLKQRMQISPLAVVIFFHSSFSPRYMPHFQQLAIVYSLCIFRKLATNQHKFSYAGSGLKPEPKRFGSIVRLSAHDEV